MLKTMYRLPAHVKLVQVTHYKTPFFQLRVARNTLPHNRYGFVVSKAVDKRAVVRNTIKRMIRAHMEQLHTQLTQGDDFLFVLQKPALTAEKTALRASLVTTLQKGGYLAHA